MTRTSRCTCLTVGLAFIAATAMPQMEETAGRAQPTPPSSGFVIRGSTVATGTPPPGAVSSGDAASTSPLQVLRQVPRVQFEGRDKVKPANTPFPVSTPIGPAPEIVPNRDEIAETPGSARKSPDPTKKPGKIRGFLGSIPVIGPKVAGRTPQPEEADSAVPTPGPAEAVPDSAQPGMDSARTVPPPPALYPPPPDRDGGSQPANTGVSRPVVSTSENPAGSGYRPNMTISAALPAESTDDGVTTSSHVSPLTAQPRPGVVTGGTGRRPSVEGDLAISPRDFSADRAPRATPGGVMIAPGHAPVTAATPPAPPAETAPPVAAAVSRAARNTSPTLEPNDLAMPNPAVEDNEALRDSYTAAVYLARSGNYELASDQFREFASRHPSSRLAPRALFLAALVEPDPAKAADARELLKINYADSDYTKELAVRQPGADASTSSTALKNTTARLESEVASAGDGPQTVAARLELVRNYARLRQYDRALEIAKPLAADVQGKPEEAEVLDLTATCHIGKGDNAAAKSELETLLKNFPQYPGRPRARLNMGLASEQEGNYQRALAEYRALATDSPGTEEARLATERIADLQKLSN